MQSSRWLTMNRRRARLGLAVVILVAVGAVGVQLVRSQWAQYVQRLSSGDLDLLPAVAQRIQNFRRVKMKGGRKQWEVAAREAQYLEDENQIVVREPEVSFYLEDADGVVALSGTTGRLVLNGREMERAELEGGIEVRFKRYVVRTDRAVYRRADGTVVSPSPVSVAGDGLTLSGARMTVDMDAQRVELQGGVETVVQGRGAGDEVDAGTS
jgi:LPS export ABC transporter protein LptC